MPEDHHDDDQTQSFVPLTEGTEAGHYKIISRIGSGGMGEVYLAQDTQLDRKVALKFLSLHLCQDVDCRKRFMREARAIAKISHPNIITIYEVAEFKGRPYLSIELVDGPSLKDKVEDDKLELTYILELAIQIGEALSVIHDLGVVHRDIKPSNILIDREGSAHLADFGLVHVEDATELTQPGSMMGTLGYMSPEQIKGEPVDCRSDIFSFGVVLYEAITGLQPFRKASKAASLEAILNTEPDSISHFRPDVPHDFERLIERMISKSTSDRFQNVDDLLIELKKQRDALGLGIEVDELQIRDTVNNNVLVMHFRNMIDPNDENRDAEIITNLLITGLSESRDLHVVSSQQIFDILKGLGETYARAADHTLATQIARRAKAKWIILGDLLQLRPSITVTSQIVDTNTGRIISARRLSSNENEDIFFFSDRLLNHLYVNLPVSTSGSRRLDRSVTEVTTSSQEAYRYYLEGMEHFYKYLESEADKCFELAIKQDPSFAMAYYRRARRPIGTDKEKMIKQAVKYSTRASRKERLYISAMDARIEGDYERSAGELEKIISNYPNEKEALLLLGNLSRLAIGDVEKGIHYYEEVLKLDPVHVEAYLSLAYAYFTMGKYYLSLRAANKLVELAPDNPNSFDSLGDIYSWNGEIDQGLEAFLKAVEIDGRFLHSIHKAGVLYTFKQHFKRAEELFRRLSSCDDIEYRACGRFSLSLIPYYRGRFQEAITTLDTGLAADELEDYGGIWRAYKYLIKGKIYLERGDYLMGINDINLSAELFREIDSAILYPKVILCLALGASGDVPAAQKVLQEIRINLKKHRRGREAVYYVAAGLLDYSQGRYIGAERNLFKATQDPLIWLWEGVNRFELFTIFGETYIKLQNFEKAAYLLENTNKEFSLDRLTAAISGVKICYFLGIAYEESGWKEKAINNYEAFLDIWKDADPGIEEIEDAQKRLAHLKSRS